MNGRPWTFAETYALKGTYADYRTEDIARALGRSVTQVYAKAKVLGLQKSAAFRASDLSGRVQRGRQDPRLQATQFQPGLTPWNKGTHFVAGGRSAETRFKPRSPEESANYKPIGSLRINADGYLERKVSDDRSRAPARRWIGVHRLVWEKAHGPIPNGHVVVFRNGLRTTVLEEITEQRLECISRAELQRRNSIHTRLPPDVRQLVQLKGAITRQVNRIVKESQS
jgi:hypothetical protein